MNVMNMQMNMMVNEMIVVHVCEPISMTEYACRIASGSSTHLIQFDNCTDYFSGRND